jgi:NAD(P)-dependent dehydrogenase (short-subunit alcohol dehydrogenase family)
MKRVLITGGVKRVGLAISKKLASAGWHVIAHYNESEREALALADWARSQNLAVDCLQADLSSPAQIERLIPDCVDRFGRLTCLINNASQFALDSIDTIDFASFSSHLTINLFAPTILSRDFVAVAADGDPIIINLLDQKIDNLNPDFLSYTLSKCALHSLTKILATQWAGRVRVCGIAPGLALISGKQTVAGFERAWRATPTGRSTTPDEIADAVVFLQNTRSMTGETIFLDGGERLARRPRDIAFDVSDHAE